MLWFKLGWRNLWRNKRRTTIELISIGGSIFLAVIWNNLAVGTYDQMIDNGVTMGSGHIGVYHENYLEQRKTEQLIPTDDFIARIDSLPHVEHVFSRLYVPGLVRSSRENRPGGIIGIDIGSETATNPLLADSRIVEGGLPDEDNHALLGYRLAEELDIGVGNKFVVMLQGADGEIVSSLMRVSGIIRTNVRDLDSSTVVVKRGELASIIGTPDMVHEIAVLLDNHDYVDALLPEIRSIVSPAPGVHAYPWQEAMTELADSIQMDYVGLQIMVIILYIIVGIGTINTLLMSVMERNREFGVIRAIGLNRGGIRKMVLSEACVLALAGIVLGVGLGLLVTLYTVHNGIDISGMMAEQGIGGTLFEPVMYGAWDIRGMAYMIAGMFVIALLASVYPAHHVLKIRPADAMRKY